MQRLLAVGSLLVLLIAGACTPGTTTEATAPEIGLETLRAEHPRLHLTPDVWERVEKLARTDQTLQAIIANVDRQARAMLDEPVIERPGLRSSRRVLGRITTLGMAARLSKDDDTARTYHERAVRELLAAAALPDWNPRHFLDVAEMTTAFAIGYDWLYHDLTLQERQTIRDAIVQKGLEAGLEAYANDAVWVARNPSNWNQVCNAGLALGALAVADEEPEIARAILERVRASAPNGMHTYNANGGYREGPMYWWYGTHFNVLLVDALQTALGTDWGFSEEPGLDSTAAFRIHATSPDRRFLFCYGDCHYEADPAPALFWLSRRFSQPQWADFQRTRLEETIEAKADSTFSRLSAFDVAWYVPPEGSSFTEMPLDAHFRGPQGDAAMLRSAWGDPDAIFVAFAGFSNRVSHSHLDHGAFVLHANGVRWAHDLGSETYSLPDFWDYQEGGVRWTYYRNSSLSHNTLTIGGQLQRADAKARVVSLRSEPDYAHAIMDLSETYAGQAEKVRRGLALPGRSRLLVQDELALSQAETPVRWAMLTDAEVQLDGSTAVLTRDGRTLRVEVLSPAGATFEVLSTDPGDPRQNRNEGTRMLATTVRPGADGRLLLAVLLTPMGPEWPEEPAPELVPLDTWGRTIQP